MFLARASSTSEIGSLSLLSSSTATLINSAECEPGPSTVIPKIPLSVKWELIEEAESTKSCYCIMFVTARQYIPLPGPPELKAVHEPSNVFATWKAVTSGSVQGTDSKAKVMFVLGLSVQMRDSPPMYSDF